MDLKSVNEFIKSVFNEDMWIFQIIFCLIAPAFLFILLLSYKVFISIDVIKLLLTSIIINIILLYLFLNTQPNRYEHIKQSIKEKEIALDEKQNTIKLQKEKLSYLKKHSIIDNSRNMKENILKKKKEIKSLELELNKYDHSFEDSKQELLIETVDRVFINISSMSMVIILAIILKYIFGCNLGKILYVLSFGILIPLIILYDRHSFNKE